MKYIFGSLLLILIPLNFYSQVQSVPKTKVIQNQNYSDTSSIRNNRNSNKVLKNKDATIELYKIVSSQRDTVYVDTTLSIQKEYKFNYLRKDNFNLISFSNLGQTYNTLSLDVSEKSTLPLFGARARHFNYMEIEDISYYKVPTPFTELFYKSGFQQGQVLDAFITINTSKQFNFSFAYKGLRSLGKYQHILTSTGNFRFTTNYNSKNNKYRFRGHIVMQDLLNQENGGLKDDDIPNFESGDPEFIDRSVFDPNFQNAENILKGKRFYLDHEYDIINKKDSLQSNKLTIGNIISFEDKYYQFDQTNQDDYFGEAFRNTNLSDRTTLENFYSRAYLNYSNNTIGNIVFNLDYNNFNYGYDAIVVIDDQIIRNRIKGDNINVGGKYEKSINKFNILGEANLNVSGEFTGHNFKALLAYQINKESNINILLNSNSKPANYNFLLYQSDYLNYNWDNINSFKNIETNQLSISYNSNKIANIYIDYSTINNHSYFNKSDSDNFVKPFQYDDVVNYFRIKLQKEIKYKNFALDNTLMYQEVIDGNEVLNVPQFITRNTLYYSNHLFKKALFLQTGVTFNLFSKYYMNAYDPLLAEFYIQDRTNLGNFPRLDFFINAKIRQTRIYLKAEHFNSAFTGYNYYSAPNYPYRDFTVRFGLVWNFFL